MILACVYKSMVDATRRLDRQAMSEPDFYVAAGIILNAAIVVMGEDPQKAEATIRVMLAEAEAKIAVESAREEVQP